MANILIEQDDHVQVQDEKGNTLISVAFSEAPETFEDETEQYEFAREWAIECTQHIYDGLEPIQL